MFIKPAGSLNCPLPPQELKCSLTNKTTNSTSGKANVVQRRAFCKLHKYTYGDHFLSTFQVVQILLVHGDYHFIVVNFKEVNLSMHANDKCRCLLLSYLISQFLNAILFYSTICYECLHLQ